MWQNLDTRMKHNQALTNIVKLGEQFSRFTHGVNTWATANPHIIEGLRGGLRNLAELGQGLRRAYEQRLEHYPRLSENLGELARQGWFVGLDMPLSTYEHLAFSLERLSDKPNRTKALDDLFVSCFQQEIESLCKNLLENYPHRAFAIRPAVAAHLRGEYALSVPVFFSQAEGIVRDETACELFTKPRGRPEVHVSDFAGKKRVIVGQTNNPFDYFEDALWVPLCLDLPLTWNPEKRRQEQYSGLNRNTTLHGIDLEYASEVNSLKVFSFLCYVGSLFDSERKKLAEEASE